MDAVDVALGDLVRAQARPAGWAWLEATRAGVAAGSTDIAVVFPAVGREVGRDGLTAPHPIELATGDRISIAAWRLDDAARALLIRAHGGGAALARRLYDTGDARERAGALRALSVLTGADRDAAGLPAVLDAMRHSEGEIFAAAICDSPYAAWHLPQHEWRKAVLKTVFVGLAIDRIVLLDRRADAELAHSLYDLVTEREAATRSVEPALWPVMASHPPPGLAGKLIGYLEHPAPAHRASAARALATIIRGGDPRPRAFLADRATREDDADTRSVMTRALDGA